MDMTTIRIKKGTGRSLKASGSWIYDNEIDTISGDYQNGDMVNVEDFDGYPLGQGFINTKSTIAIRMMTRKKEIIVDEALIEQRVRNRWRILLAAALSLEKPIFSPVSLSINFRMF